MQVTVYSNFRKEYNSTKQPSGGKTIDVRLKDPTSELAPVFRVHGYDLSHNYLKWGNNYYYIRDKILNTNEEAEYHCEKDVFATYKSDIGVSNQYVTRSASEYDPDVVDGMYATTNSPSGVRKLLTSLSSYISSEGTYVIGIKTSASPSGVKYYAMDRTNYALLTAFMFSDQYFTADDISFDLQKMIMNPMDYISSCYWYPFSLSPGALTRDIMFGYWTCNTAEGHVIPEDYRVFEMSHTISASDIPKHPQHTRGNYLNRAPYTRMYVDVFGFGRTPIDANYLASGDSITVNVAVDLYTGQGELTVECGDFRALRMSSMLGVPIQLSQSTQDLIKPLYNAVTGIAMLTKGHFLGATGQIINAIESCMPQIQTSGSMGSKMAFNESPEIDFEFYKLCDEDNTTIGRPLCKPRRINTLRGYIVCENVDLLTSANLEEKKEIISVMESGFFYE